MTMEAVAAVLQRNSTASVVQHLEGGRVRVRRSRYAYTPTALYLPAWRNPKWGQRQLPLVVECHVSELDGLREWSYVWARGVMALLSAANDAAEREAWREGIHHLRRVMLGLRSAKGPTLATYHILRVEIQAQGGITLRIG